MSLPLNNFYNSLDKILANVQESSIEQMNNDNLLYNIIDQKDQIILNMKQTNKSLSDVISLFNKNINNTNKNLNDMLSKISTTNDINYIMYSQKNLTNKNNLLTLHNQDLTRDILKSRETYNTLRNTYMGLNKLYISKFNTVIEKTNQDFATEDKIQLLEDRVNHLNSLFKCHICFSKCIDIIILPCFHIYICKECVEQIIENTNDQDPVNCPVCNERIVEYKNIYLPI